MLLPWQQHEYQLLFGTELQPSDIQLELLLSTPGSRSKAEPFLCGIQSFWTKPGNCSGETVYMEMIPIPLDDEWSLKAESEKLCLHRPIESQAC